MVKTVEDSIMQIIRLKSSTGVTSDTTITITSDPKVEVQRSLDDGALYHWETQGNGAMCRTEWIDGKAVTVVEFPNN